MDAVLVTILIIFINTFLVKVFVQKYNVLSESYLWVLFVVHAILCTVYTLYAAATASDSVQYYVVSSTTKDWFSLWGTSTTFIYFLAWPFTYLFNLGYLSAMIIFSYFGYLGILLFYFAAKENVKLPAVWGKLTLVEIVFLLPNLHFWSSSLGKGSVILFGLSLFALGLSRFNRRYITLLLGGFLTFMVRPHILFTAILSIMLVLLITSSGIKNYLRWLIFIVAAVVFFYISDDVAEFTEIESFNVLNSDVLQHRASELGKSTSGVNLQDYSLPMKMFTFWFRPLFIDGQGIMGILVSFENLAYIFMFAIVIKRAFVAWGDWNGYYRICLVFFLFGSLALAQVTGNLGIAIRQKAQLMPFFFILFLKAASFSTTIQNRLVMK